MTFLFSFIINGIFVQVCQTSSTRKEKKELQNFLDQILEVKILVDRDEGVTVAPFVICNYDKWASVKAFDIQFVMIVQVIIALLITSSLQAQNCQYADALECGASICATFHWENGTCVSVPSSTCTTNDSVPTNSTGAACTSCSSLAQAACSSTCIDWYYSNSGSCKSCRSKHGDFCVTCTQSTCTACAYSSGTTIVNTTCSSSTNCSSNCISCYDFNGNSRCQDCSPGYSVDQNYTCTSTGCNIAYCNQCNTVNVQLCDSCASGYTTNPNKTGCVAVCQDTKCTSCLSPNNCGACQTGYYVSNGACVINCTLNVVNNCQECSSLSVCTGCTTGYKVLLGGTLCSPICNDTNCQICSNPNAGSCTNCNPGYTLNNSTGSCETAICNIDYCATCLSTTACQSCASHFTLANTNTSCTPTCASTVSNCILCSNSTQCSACSGGYTLSGNNTCVKICSISNCDICASSDTCSSCLTGYTPSTSKTSCRLICSVQNCFTCNPASVCTACNTGFALASSSSCIASCSSGYVNTGTTSNPVCTLCSTNTANCQTCQYISSETKCTGCLTTYFLNGISKCDLCSSALTNCHECSSATTCTSCSTGILINGACKVSSCLSSVTNCLYCGTNSSVCQTCLEGFTNNNGTCELSCADTYVYSPSLGKCACPDQTYQNNGACVSCSDSFSKCNSCNAQACLACDQGYFVSGTTCSACTSNCQKCTSDQTCELCADGYYTRPNGRCKAVRGKKKVATAGNTVYQCPAGCLTCDVNAKLQVSCTSAKDGYSIVLGIILPCDPSCKTCSGSTSSSCTSCYFGKALKGGSCIACTDSNALTCLSTNADYSLTCKSGYTSTYTSISGGSQQTGGVCRACSSFCDKCDNSGAGNCDKGHCFPGFVRFTNTPNCTACFSGCATCTTSNLNECLSCPAGQYLSNSQCLACTSPCATCSGSATTCSSCISGYELVSNACFALPVACAQLSSTDTSKCGSCFAGYSLSTDQTACNTNTTCNSTGSCTTCPNSYYLVIPSGNTTGQCFACPTISNCGDCNPETPTQCILCNTGYYVSSGVCQTCTTGCSDCISSVFCNTASDGFYLIKLFSGQNTGTTAVCQTPCATCVNSPDNCKSCVTGYTLNGSSCITNSRVALTLVLTTGTGANAIDLTSSKSLFNGFTYVFRIKKAICQALPATFDVSTDKKCFLVVIFNFMQPGSLTIGSSISGGSFGSADQADSAISSSFTSSTQLDGAGVVSSTAVATGFTSTNTSSSSTNLGLILGLSIPLVLLLALIIVILAINRSKSTENTAGEDIVGQTQNEKYRDPQDANYDMI